MWGVLQGRIHSIWAETTHSSLPSSIAALRVEGLGLPYAAEKRLLRLLVQRDPARRAAPAAVLCSRWVWASAAQAVAGTPYAGALAATAATCAALGTCGGGDITGLVGSILFPSVGVTAADSSHDPPGPSTLPLGPSVDFQSALAAAGGASAALELCRDSLRFPLGVENAPPAFASTPALRLKQAWPPLCGEQVAAADLRVGDSFFCGDLRELVGISSLLSDSAFDGLVYSCRESAGLASRCCGGGLGRVLRGSCISGESLPVRVDRVRCGVDCYSDSSFSVGVPQFAEERLVATTSSDRGQPLGAPDASPPDGGCDGNRHLALPDSIFVVGVSVSAMTEARRRLEALLLFLLSAADDAEHDDARPLTAHFQTQEQQPPRLAMLVSNDQSETASDVAIDAVWPWQLPPAPCVADAAKRHVSTASIALHVCSDTISPAATLSDSEPMRGSSLCAQPPSFQVLRGSFDRCASPDAGFETGVPSILGLGGTAGLRLGVGPESPLAPLAGAPSPLLGCCVAQAGSSSSPSWLPTWATPDQPELPSLRRAVGPCTPALIPSGLLGSPLPYSSEPFHAPTAGGTGSRASESHTGRLCAAARHVMAAHSMCAASAAAVMGLELSPGAESAALAAPGKGAAGAQRDEAARVLAAAAHAFLVACGEGDAEGPESSVVAAPLASPPFSSASSGCCGSDPAAAAAAFTSGGRVTAASSAPSQPGVSLGVSEACCGDGSAMGPWWAVARLPLADVAVQHALPPGPQGIVARLLGVPLRLRVRPVLADRCEMAGAEWPPARRLAPNS